MSATATTPLTLHLRLVIRQQRSGAFRVVGDRDTKIGVRHRTGRDAERAIRDYCREQGCTAFVQIFFPPGILWREDSINTDGSIRSVYGPGSKVAVKRKVTRSHLPGKAADARVAHVRKNR